jgi:hypothetical protein
VFTEPSAIKLVAPGWGNNTDLTEGLINRARAYEWRPGSAAVFKHAMRLGAIPTENFSLNIGEQARATKLTA